ncbi:MAG: hypothetical protein HY059_20360 [Proteobacteria bacterium]|nr:hypothetical protein [Pseudomonadota bacterium]
MGRFLFVLRTREPQRVPLAKSTGPSYSHAHELPEWTDMRAEIAAVAEEIKQSLVLLRRFL